MDEIARAQRLPKSSLAKVLSGLARARIIASQRGPGGGYALTRSAKTISLAQIVAAVEARPTGSRRCLLEQRGCGEGSVCRLHEVVLAAEKKLWTALCGIALSDYSVQEKK